MMLYKIMEKLESGRENNTFKRIDSDHPIDIYVGYNDKNEPTLAIIGKGSIKSNVESTKYVEVSVNNKDKHNTTLSFSLLDLSMSIIFYKLCEDLIESSRNIKKENALFFMLDRWNNWRQMFNKKSISILSSNQITGLLGELIVLHRYMIPKYGLAVAIQSWMGPDMSHKDYELLDTWYEVKTIHSSSLSVKISSIEQLDSKNIGHLIIVKLEKTNKNAYGSLNLNSYINTIEKHITDFSLLTLFRKKLSLIGYFPDNEYDECNFFFVSMNKYVVNSEFPKIEKESLYNGIIKISYEILINSIEEFMEEGIS